MAEQQGTVLHEGHILEEIQASDLLTRLYEKFDGTPKEFAAWWSTVPELTKASFKLGLL